MQQCDDHIKKKMLSCPIVLNTVAARDCKSCEIVKEPSWWNISVYVVSWQRLRNVIQYIKRVLERLGEVKMEKLQDRCQTTFCIITTAQL